MTRGATGKNFAIALGAAVALLLAGVYVWQLSGQFGPARATLAPSAPVGAAPNAAGATVAAEAPVAPAQLVFEAGSDRLPAGSMDLLSRVADDARAHSGATVEISGFYPSGGDAKAEADLATRRVQAARHALEANGVPAASLRGGVGVAPAGSDERAARRVEIAVR